MTPPVRFARRPPIPGMGQDIESLLRGADSVGNPPRPAGLRKRLAIVAGLLREAPLGEGTRLLWRNDRREVVSLALRGPVVIGRDSTCDLTFADSRLSRRHCRVTPTESGVWVEDLGSTNGTEVNDRRMRRARLRDGDVLTLGGQALAFVAAGR